MAFPFGCSDVAAGAKLAWSIWQNGFVEDNSASVQYGNFASEIRGFATLLDNLEASIGEAYGRYNRVALHRNSVYNPIAEDFESERRSFVGDFRATLKECRDLLEQKKWALQRKSTVQENLYFNLSDESRIIEDLRRRIHFHSTKIKLVIDRLSINLLTDVDSRIDRLLDIAERQLQLTSDVRQELHLFYAQFLGVHAGQAPRAHLRPDDNHVASPAIEQKFREALDEENPSASHNGDIPLEEGFTVLLGYYEDSTMRGDQTPEKYLALLKTRWLMGEIQRSQAYLDACPGFYYKRAVNQIELAIKNYINERSLRIFDEDQLLDLPESEFLIWPPASAPKPPMQDFLKPIGNEIEVVSIRLDAGKASELEKLVIFRGSNKGNFRIAQEGTNHDGRAAILNLPGDIESEKLIPLYALPNANQRRPKLGIFSRGTLHEFPFRSFKELLEFQAAITGREIPYPENGMQPRGIQCQFSQKVHQLDCRGDVQIWQDPIELFSFSSDTDSDPSGNSRRAASISSPAIELSSASTHSDARSVGHNSTIRQTIEGEEADDIRLPSLVIFPRLDKIVRGVALTILYMQLDADFLIDPTACACSEAYNKCSIITLKRKKDKSLPLRIASSRLDSQGYPDPTSFDLLSFQKKSNGKPEFEVKHTDYLMLGFNTLEEKKDFHEALNQRFALIDRQIELQQDHQRDMRYNQSRTVQKRLSNRSGEFVSRNSSVSTNVNGYLPSRSASNAYGRSNRIADHPPAVLLSRYPIPHEHEKRQNTGNASTTSEWAQSQINSSHVFQNGWKVSQRGNEPPRPFSRSQPSEKGQQRPQEKIKPDASGRGGVKKTFSFFSHK